MKRRKQGAKIAVKLPLETRLSIADMPEVLAALRHELAVMLRQVADEEAPPVAARLLAVAAAFEAGQSGDDRL